MKVVPTNTLLFATQHLSEEGRHGQNIVIPHVDTVYSCYGYSFLCLTGCFSMTIWTPTALSALYACVLYFCICTCSAQLSMFHMERRSRNTLIIITIILTDYLSGVQALLSGPTGVPTKQPL